VTLLKLKYSVQIADDCVERERTVASKIPSCYSANFKLNLIRHTEETSNYTMAWQFHVMEQNMYH